MLSVLLVFLVLAALYESWTIPLSVLLTVPLGILGAVTARCCAGCRTTSISPSAS
jgi:multidrug efflux pump